MTNENAILGSEKAAGALKTLYSRYGYSHFKMSKFEKYDLYAQNRNFLRGDRMITFTDNGGQLLALRPDVTLSIVKNIRPDISTEKVYYTENVYRTAKTGEDMSEIMQVGLECLGNIDLYQTGEVILLAIESLLAISENCLIDISHMGFLSALLSEATDTESVRDALVAAFREKNAHSIRDICEGAGISSDICARLSRAATLYGPLRTALPALASVAETAEETDALAELSALLSILDVAGYADKVRLDLSTVNDMSYYNGIILNGFIEGIPDAVLTGGRYDNLLAKMGKTGGAIGFAVYLDLLERYNTADFGFDADILLLYGDDTDAVTLTQAVKRLQTDGASLRVGRDAPANFRAEKVFTMKNGEAVLLENHD